MNIRVADYVAQFLVDRGIFDIFVLTGTYSMYLNDAIVSHPKLAYYCPRHEAAGLEMAAGYARMKQSFGAICVTAGPGATNAISGLAEAWLDAAPVIVLSGQVPRKHTTHELNIPGLRTFGTAEINVIPAVRSMTKYAAVVTKPDSIRYHLEKAAYLARNGHPGPVWLEIPLDVQSAMIDAKKLKGFVPLKLKKEPVNVAACIKLLQSAKRPLIVAGNGIRQGDAVEPFRKAADTLHIPIVTTRFGNDLLPYSHPAMMGMGGVKGTRFCRTIMRQADVVLALGSRLAVPFIGYDEDFFDPSAKIISVDIEQAELKKPGVTITLPIHANIKDFLEKLKIRSLPSWKAWLRTCQDLKERHPMITDDMKSDPIDLYYFMSRLDALAGKHHVFVSDSGSNYYVAGQVYRFEQGQREISSVTNGAMGLSIPLAIGASLARKDMQVLAVTGDGSLELNIQDLKTMSYYGSNIKLFVINNGGYASMRKNQDTFFKGRRIGSDEKTGVATLNLEAVARAFDLRYERIQHADEIDRKLKTIMRDKKPLFVEVVCASNQSIITPMGAPKFYE